MSFSSIFKRKRVVGGVKDEESSFLDRDEQEKIYDSLKVQAFSLQNRFVYAFAPLTFIVLLAYVAAEIRIAHDLSKFQSPTPHAEFDLFTLPIGFWMDHLVHFFIFSPGVVALLGTLRWFVNSARQRGLFRRRTSSSGSAGGHAQQRSTESSLLPSVSYQEYVDSFSVDVQIHSHDSSTASSLGPRSYAIHAGSLSTTPLYRSWIFFAACKCLGGGIVVYGFPPFFSTATSPFPWHFVLPFVYFVLCFLMDRSLLTGLHQIDGLKQHMYEFKTA